MPPAFQSENSLTALANSWNGPDATVRDRFTSIVYAELHRLAGLRMRTEPPGHMLQASALVNETFLRFMESNPRKFRDRTHFFAFMSRVMRQILVDFARSSNAAKRRDGGQSFDLAAAENVPAKSTDQSFVDLDVALAELAELDERQARVVELRYFGGLEIVEIARVLGVSDDTVSRDWRIARLWLFARLNPEAANQNV